MSSQNQNKPKDCIMENLTGSTYIDGFLTYEEANTLTEEMEELLRQKTRRSSKVTWGITGYSGPKLMVYGSTGADPKRLYSQALPEPLRRLVDRVTLRKFHAQHPPSDDIPSTEDLPFQVTVNFYTDGLKELIPHKDGMGKQVAILTLASHTVLEFGYYPNAPAKFTKVFPLMLDEKPASLSPKDIEHSPYDPSPDDHSPYDHGHEESEEAEPSSLGYAALPTSDPSAGTDTAHDNDEASSVWHPKKSLQPIQRVWVRHGGLLLLTGPSFLDWAHGVRSRSEDVYDSASIANAAVLDDLQDGQVIRRGPRISIVIWS